MLRILIEGVFLFLLPFALFALTLLLRGLSPLHPEVWSKQVLSWLTIAALLLCVLSIVGIGLRQDVQTGGFVPSHVDKDGKFVPGQFNK